MSRHEQRRQTMLTNSCGVQNAYMQGYIYASTTWRVTSSVPTQYRRYMYSSVVDFMVAGSLAAHSSQPVSNQSLSSNETGLAFALHHVDRLDQSSSEGGCGLLARTDSHDVHVACLFVLWFLCSILVKCSTLRGAGSLKEIRGIWWISSERVYAHCYSSNTNF